MMFLIFFMTEFFDVYAIIFSLFSIEICFIIKIVLYVLMLFFVGVAHHELLLYARFLWCSFIF